MQFDRYLFAFFCALCVCVFDIPTCTLNRLRSPGKKKTVRYGTRPGECHAEGALLPERLVREENAGADAERQRWTGDHGSWCNSTSGFILWYPLRNTYINRHSTWEFVSVSFRTWASDLKILSQRIFSQNLAVAVGATADPGDVPELCSRDQPWEDDVSIVSDLSSWEPWWHCLTFWVIWCCRMVAWCSPYLAETVGIWSFHDCQLTTWATA